MARRVEQRLAGAQRFLGPLAVGDVEVDARHSQRPTLGIAQSHPTSAVDPHPMSVAVRHAELDLVVGPRAIQVGLARRRHRRPVVGMNQVQEVAVDALAQALHVVAEHLGIGGVDLVLAALEVDLPGACVRALDDQRQALALACQFVGGTPAGGDVGAHRHVLLDPAVGAEEGGDDAVHPVQGAVLRAVADLPAPRPAGRNRQPHLAPERSRVNTRVDDAVVLAEKLVAGVAADRAERVVGLDDAARAVGHRDDGVGADRAEQRLVVAQCRGQRDRGAPALGDVRLDRHPARQPALFVAHGLDLDFDPVLLPVLAQVVQLAVEGLACVEGLLHPQLILRLGRAAAQQFARPAAQRLGWSEAGRAHEAVVDPDDAARRVEDQYRVAGVAGHRRQPLDLERQADDVRLGYCAGTRALPRQVGQEGRQNQPPGQREPGRGTVGAGHGGSAACAQRHAGAEEVQCPVVPVACGACARRPGRLPFGVVDGRSGCAAVTGEQREVQAIAQHGLAAREQFGGNDGGIQHALEGGPALCLGARRGTLAIDRQIEQEARRAPVVLLQHDGLGERRLAAGDRPLDGRPAVLLAADVQAECGRIGGKRFDVLDDVAIGVRPRGQLADREVRRVVGALGGREGGLVGLKRACDEPESAHTGKLTSQVVCRHHRAKLAALDALACREGAECAPQAVQRRGEAAIHLVACALGQALELVLGLTFQAVVQSHGAGHAQHDTERGDQCWQRGGPLGPGRPSEHGRLPRSCVDGRHPAGTSPPRQSRLHVDIDALCAVEGTGRPRGGTSSAAGLIHSPAPAEAGLSAVCADGLEPWIAPPRSRCSAYPEVVTADGLEPRVTPQSLGFLPADVCPPLRDPVRVAAHGLQQPTRAAARGFALTVCRRRSTR